MSRFWATYRNDGTAVYEIDGRRVTKAEYDRRLPSRLDLGGGLPAVGTAYSRPLVSQALGVHPAQVAEANERNKKNGVATRYAPDGAAVIPSRGDRKKLLRLEGMHDNDGGYGD